MDWKGLLADHFGQFAVKDAANLLVAVVAAAILGALVARMGARRASPEARVLALWSALFAAGVGLVRAQLPLALALVALALLVQPTAGKVMDRLALGSMLVIGLACGSGATVIAVGIAFVLIVLFRWAGRSGAEPGDTR